jgi:hypothetical protein
MPLKTSCSAPKQQAVNFGDIRGYSVAGIAQSVQVGKPRGRSSSPDGGNNFFSSQLQYHYFG